jgi:hypothetical protein
VNRTRPIDVTEGGLEALVSALLALDFTVGDGGLGGGIDRVVHTMVDDRPLSLMVQVKAYCTGAMARQLLDHNGPKPDRPLGDTLPVLVADKITTEAQELLSDAGWSWLDRRGRLHLRGPAVRVDADVPTSPSTPPSQTLTPVAGPGGMAVAYWLCAHPDKAISPNRQAAGLTFAPSTISTATRRLAAAGLVDSHGRAVIPELFFELAAVWRTDRTWLATPPPPSAHLSADRSAPTWRRTGTAAAAAYGVPMVAAEGGPVELYVPGPVEVTISSRRYGVAQPGTGAAVVGVAPTAAVCAHPDDAAIVDVDGWPAAPVLAIALDLAQDRARGLEILREWEHPDAVWR